MMLVPKESIAEYQQPHDVDAPRTRLQVSRPACEPFSRRQLLL